MILVIGEVLIDVFPESRRIGGAPFNFAFHLIQMGFPVKFITRVGADADGKRVLSFMRRFGFDLEYVQVDETRKTGQVMVYPDQAGVPGFEIVADVAYDYIALTDAVKQVLRTPPALIYFGTLIQRTSVGRQALRDICRSRCPETRCFYDINLRPGCYSRDIVRQSLSDTDILKLNDEELDVIRGMFGLPEDTVSAVERLIRDYSLTMVALTKGARGSEFFTGTDHVNLPPSPGNNCVDTVGAGDAFAAVLAAGYLKKRNMRQILPVAADFAGRICGISGAVPESRDFYKGLTL